MSATPRMSDEKLLRMLDQLARGRETSVAARAGAAAASRLRAVETFKAEVTNSCGACDYDEAEGGLVNHCPKCCHRIATAAWAFVHQEKP